VKSINDKFCKPLRGDKKFCMEYKTEYPLVYGGEKRVTDNINRAISKLLPSDNAQSYVAEHIDEYLDDDSDSFMLEHSDETKIELFSLTRRTFTIKLYSDTYTGGAHGMHGIAYYNYDKYTGEELKLDDLFLSHSKKSLKMIAERHYRDIHGLSAYDDLTTKDDWLVSDFVLPGSIAITKDGLYLTYNPYEIKAYASGFTHFMLPYYLLESIIPADSYLSPLLEAQKSENRSGVSKKLFKETADASMKIEAKRLSGNRVSIDVTATNLSGYRIGGISLSFPQLTRSSAILGKRQRGFAHIKVYPRGSRLYYAPTKRSIRSRYILIESDTKHWYRGVTKSISTTVRVPRSIDRLDIFVRIALRKGRSIIEVPYEGIEGQQGFRNYHIDIPL